MIFIKNFDAESEYKAYRDGRSYEMPNVSLSKDVEKVHYNLDANGYDYVDLELPSGTLWATCNVGASKPSESGLYFQWGDTQGYTTDQIGTGSGKKNFASDWSDYKWYSGGNFTKYTTTGAALNLEDDAANANMDGDWQMPNPKQIDELISNTTSTWTTLDEVKGRIFTSIKDSSKSIFIPAAGRAWNGSFKEIGRYCGIWSSMLSTSNADNGQSLYFYKYLGPGMFNYGRFNGRSVRGVIG